MDNSLKEMIFNIQQMIEFYEMELELTEPDLMILHLKQIKEHLESQNG